MIKVLDITATTSDKQLEEAIPFLDMKHHAIERRGHAATNQWVQPILELHNVDGIVVLYSPVYGYAYVNERSTGTGNSLIMDNETVADIDDAVTAWRG